MRYGGKVSLVASAAVLLALAGAGVASAGFMGSGGMSMGAGGAGTTHEPGAMMGGATGAGTTHEPGAMMGGATGAGTTHEPGAMMGGATGAGTGLGQGSMGPGHMFGDVAPGEWYEGYAEQMAQHGFMSGFADGSFGGDQSITRGQFAGIMARMMGLEAVAGATFSDTAGFWGAGAVEALAQNGIVAGYANGAFGPYDHITRAQMTAMMDRAWQWMEENGMAPGLGLGMGDAEMTRLREEMHERLHDVQGHWAEDHIAHMFRLGVVQGGQDGMFRPQAATNRAQAGAMMWRWYEAVQQ